MRFILIGVGLIFAGFLTLGTIGSQFNDAAVETGEFDTCYTYSDDSPPVEVDCADKLFVQTIFFALIIGLIGAGVLALVKGMRGDWDSKIRPEDMVGPGRSGNQGEPK